MPIPETAEFDQALASITLKVPAEPEAWRSVVLIAATPPWARGIGSMEYQEQRLWIPRSAALTPEALLKRVQKECEVLRHTSTAEVAGAILGLFSTLRRNSRSLAALLNTLLKGVLETDMTQWFILPGEAPQMPVRRLGPFRIGRLDHERLAYRMRKAGCDFFERDGSALVGRLTFERDPIKVRLLPFAKACEQTKSAAFGPQQEGYILLDHYFRSVSESLFHDFFRTFEEEQVLRVAVGFGYADLDQMRLLPGVLNVGLFSRVGEGSRGWGCPATSIPHGDFASLDKAVPVSERFLGSFGVGRRGPTELDRTLRTVARFRMRAAKFLMAGDLDEAFLSHVIALDLLLGERTAATKSVTKRCAALVHRALGVPYEKQCKRLDALYDVRSRFVHSGVSPDSSAQEEVGAISEEVLYCLLRLNSRDSCHSEGFRSRWVGDLDILVAKLDAGREPPPEELRECGIQVNTEERTRPVFDLRLADEGEPN